MFCKECGHKLNANMTFCPECGTSHVIAPSEIKRNVHINQMEQGYRLAKKTTKKPFWSYILMGIILVLLVGSAASYQYIKSITSEKVVKEDFLEALRLKDMTSLIEIIQPKDARIIVDPNSLQALFDYIDDHPSFVGVVEEELEKNRGLFSIRKLGKKYLFFDHYVMDVKGTLLHVAVKESDVSLYINDRLIDQSASSKDILEYGPFFPGSYVLKGQRTTEYTTIVEEQKVNLLGEPTGVNQLEMEGMFIEVASNEPYARLYVNGKDTGYYIKDLTNFGPVSRDGSLIMYVQIDSENGPIRSKEIVLTDQSSLYFEINKQNPSTSTKSNIPTTDPQDYILPFSHIKYLTTVELINYTKEELRIARNEIYARHGYVFQSEDLRQYFLTKHWYVPNPNYKGDLTEIEKYNVDLIKSIEEGIEL